MNYKLDTRLQDILDTIITTAKLLDYKINAYVDEDILFTHTSSTQYQIRGKITNIVLSISIKHHILQTISFYDKSQASETIYSSYEKKNHKEILQKCLNLVLESRE